MTEEAAVAIDTGGVETTIPNQTPVETPAESINPTFQDIVPQAYKDEAWIKDVKDIDGFFKMTGDMKSELGKRAEASPQAPENVDGYELSAPQEGSEDFQKAVKEMFLKNGVSSELAKALDADWNEMVQKFAPDKEALDADFDKRTEALFGDKTDDVLAKVKGLIAANTPESMVEDVNGLGNKEITILAAVLDNIDHKYISEDSLPRDGGPVPGQMSNEEKRAEAKKLIALPEAGDKSHPGHAAVQLKIDKLYEGIS